MKLIVLLSTLFVYLFVSQTITSANTCSSSLFAKLEKPSGMIKSKSAAIDLLSIVLATNSKKPATIVNAFARYDMNMTTYIIEKINEDYAYHMEYQRAGVESIFSCSSVKVERCFDECVQNPNVLSQKGDIDINEQKKQTKKVELDTSSNLKKEQKELGTNKSQSSSVTAKPSTPHIQPKRPFWSSPNTGNPLKDEILAPTYKTCARLRARDYITVVKRAFIVQDMNNGARYQFYCPREHESSGGVAQQVLCRQVTNYPYVVGSLRWIYKEDYDEVINTAHQNQAQRIRKLKQEENRVSAIQLNPSVDQIKQVVYDPDTDVYVGLSFVLRLMYSKFGTSVQEVMKDCYKFIK